MPQRDLSQENIMPFRYPEALPTLKTPLPGPKGAALVARDHAVLSPSYTRDYPLVVARGYGLGIQDVDGNWFLDFTAGIAVTNTGHCHPHVVAAIADQAENLLHMSGTDFYYEPMVALAERLAASAPGTAPKRVFFTNSGAEAVEAALKLARYHTKRTRALAFIGAFHGRTYGALSLSASKVQHRRGFTPLLPEVQHAPFGDLAYIEKLFAKVVPPEEVAAIFVEPVQGEGGYIVPDPAFLLGLRSLCDKHGILLVADEVQAGMGRTGKLFASEHFNLVPDIICLAKGLASGMPLGAIVANQRAMNWQPGSHGSTFAGNPVACRAALATLDLLERGLIANAAEQGQILKKGLEQLTGKHPALGEVRGLGLMCAVDIVHPSDKKRLPELRDQIVKAAYHHGLLLLGCGETAIRFSPALAVTADQVKTALRLFDEVLAAAHV